MLVVTGANGFLGSYVVCQLLKQGNRVKGIKREASSMEEFLMISGFELKGEEALLQNLIWEEADITDVVSLDEAFVGAEMVYHCAALIAFKGGLDILLKVNAEGTANVVNACLKAGVKKLIYASSTAAIGRSDSNKDISEENTWIDDKNNTLYAESKHLAELEVWRGIEEGLDAIIVNPGIILGAGKWAKGSCRLFENVAKGLRFYTQGINGFVGVKDVATSMVYLAEQNIKNERYVLVSENISYQTLFHWIAKALDKQPPGIEIKSSYVPWISWILQMNVWLNRNSHLSPETLRTSVKKHKYNNQKLLDTGFKLTAIEKVVQETAERYKQTNY